MPKRLFPEFEVTAGEAIGRIQAASRFRVRVGFLRLARQCLVKFGGGQPCWRRHVADVRAVAGPFPVAGCLHHVRPDGVQVDVSTGFQKVVVAIHMHCLEAAFQQVAVPVVSSIESLAVGRVDAMHHLREIREPGLENKVIVVAHQAVGQDASIASSEYLGNETHHRRPIVVVRKYGGLLDAASGDVEQGAWIGEAEWVRHASESSPVKQKRHAPAAWFIGDLAGDRGQALPSFAIGVVAFV